MSQVWRVHITITTVCILLTSGLRVDDDEGETVGKELLSPDDFLIDSLHKGLMDGEAIKRSAEKAREDLSASASMMVMSKDAEKKSKIEVKESAEKKISTSANTKLSGEAGDEAQTLTLESIQAAADAHVKESVVKESHLKNLLFKFQLKASKRMAAMMAESRKVRDEADAAIKQTAFDASDRIRETMVAADKKVYALEYKAKQVQAEDQQQIDIASAAALKMAKIVKDKEVVDLNSLDRRAERNLHTLKRMRKEKNAKVKSILEEQSTRIIKHGEEEIQEERAKTIKLTAVADEDVKSSKKIIEEKSEADVTPIKAAFKKAMATISKDTSVKIKQASTIGKAKVRKLGLATDAGVAKSNKKATDEVGKLDKKTSDKVADQQAKMPGVKKKRGKVLKQMEEETELSLEHDASLTKDVIANLLAQNKKAACVEAATVTRLHQDEHKIKALLEEAADKQASLQADANAKIKVSFEKSDACVRAVEDKAAMDKFRIEKRTSDQESCLEVQVNKALKRNKDLVVVNLEHLQLADNDKVDQAKRQTDAALCQDIKVTADAEKEVALLRHRADIQVRNDIDITDAKINHAITLTNAYHEKISAQSQRIHARSQ